jgi:hypothetical protein
MCQCKPATAKFASRFETSLDVLATDWVIASSTMPMSRKHIVDIACAVLSARGVVAVAPILERHDIARQ